MEQFKTSLDSRERLSYLITGLVLVILIGGLVRLQVVDHVRLEARSEGNRIRVVPNVPRRGTVFDRQSRVIVDNRPSYTVCVVVAEEVPGKTVANLAELIDLDTAQIRRRIVRNLVSRFQPTPVKRDIPFEVVAVLEERHEKFPGVTYQIERVRQYVADMGVETFTGHVNEISPDELARSDRPELHSGSMIGKKGLERRYDQILRGLEGTALIEVNATGQILGPYQGRSGDPAYPGADITLSIDLDLQRTCLQVIDSFCCGAIVAIDPRNGEVLAMVSYPTHDANIFSTVIPEKLWQEITTDSTHPLLNRPIAGQYPPASTVKFITVGAGLEKQLITENSTFKPCRGGFRFGDRVFHCWDRGGHGALTAAHALEESCDIYMYQLGLKLGVDGLSEYYGRCGFGRPTGIELPGERHGLNPNSRWYDSAYGVRKWTRGLVLNNAIGQGEVLATPVQLAQFFCGLANDGKVFQPHLVRQITFSDGEVLPFAPTISFVLPFSSATMAVLREGIRLVVEGENGTARFLRNDRYTLGGKTGTAQNPHGENHSFFVGMAPLEAPEIVVCAMIENAGHGSEVAAPVVGKVIEAYMSKKLGDRATTPDAGDRL